MQQPAPIESAVLVGIQQALSYFRDTGKREHSYCGPTLALLTVASSMSSCYAKPCFHASTDACLGQVDSNSGK